MSATALLAALAGIAAAVGSVDFAQAFADQLARRQKQQRSALNSAFVRIVRTVGRRFGVRPPGDLEARLVASGVTISLADAMAIKIGSVVVGGLFASPILLGLPLRLALPIFTLILCAAFLGLDIWLYRRMRVRQQIIERELPDVLDLLRVALLAGMGTTRSLAEIGRRHGGLIARELQLTSNQIELGEGREAAFTRLGQRCHAPGIPLFIATLRRADRYGTSIALSLSAQSQQARADHARGVMEAAGKAGPKIQLIAAGLLVPSVLLLIAAAALPAFIDMQG